MLSNPQPKLTFGALNLIGLPTDIANFGYTFEALGDDTDWGNPVPVDQKVISWLQDGAIIARKNYDNREILVRIRVRANDSAGLAAGESALMLETGKPNLLTWTPPDGVGAPCVFSVVMSNLEHVFDDLNEDRLVRVYGLRIQAEPFVRSSTLVSVSKAAPTGTQAITTVDNCNSTTNWTQTSQVGSGAPTTTAAASALSGTAISGTASSVLQSSVTRLTVSRSSLSASMSSTPYLRIDLSIANNTLPPKWNWANGASDVSFKLNGVDAPVALQVGTIYWFDASALAITTLTTIDVTGYVIASGPNPTFTVVIADVSRSNVLGDQGTGRQLLRTLAVAGSARTQGSLAIADAANALGTTLVYTYPQVSGVVSPSLRQFYTTGAGTITTDATTVFGSTMDIGNFAPVFEIPITGIQSGGHLLLARVKHASVGARSISSQFYSKQGSGVGLPIGATATTVNFTSSAGGWSIVTLATASLPAVKVGPAGKVYILLQGSSGLLMDEAWLFNLDAGELTWLECGTSSPTAGASSNRVWLDAPTVAYPAPGAFMGFASDRSDSYHAGGGPGVAPSATGYLSSFGNHQFVPPAMNAFTVTTNSTASAITLSHYPRWHTHAVS